MVTDYIAVSGNIGSGKSTLAYFLSHVFKLEPIYEPNEKNPYLIDFYKDMKKWSFHSQISFLIDKFSIYQNIMNKNNVFIQDRTIYEDAEIFAKNLFLNGLMSERDYSVYIKLYNTMKSSISPPVLMLYLKTDIPTILERIKHRNRNVERCISYSYILGLESLYHSWISTFDLCPIYIIEAQNKNYLTDLIDQIDLLEDLKKILKR